MISKFKLFVLFIIFYSFDFKFFRKIRNRPCLKNNFLFQNPFNSFQEALRPLKQHTKLNQIVTLGSNCLTKFRALSFIEKHPDILGCNHLFDYMVPLDYSLFAEAIRNNFRDAFQEDLLTVTGDYWRSGCAVIHHSKYKFQFNHAFDGHEEVSHFGRSNRLTVRSLHKYFYLIKDKFNHLVMNSQKAFTNLNRPLYVIYASHSHSDPQKQKQADFLQVLSAIKSLRDDNFLLLVLVNRQLAAINSYNFDVIIEGNLCFHMIEFFDYLQWDSEESVKQWDEVFQSIFIE